MEGSKVGDSSGADRVGGEAGVARRKRDHYTFEQRCRAVEAYLASGLTLAGFERSYGVSQVTLRRWMRRHATGGREALAHLSDGPRRPRGQPPLAAAVKGHIVAVKQEHPTFGFRRVRDFLARFLGLRVSTGSVRRTLEAAGVPKVGMPRRRRRRASEPRRFERSRPGELWQTDITTLPVVWRRNPLYLVAFLDDFSRYVVSWGLHTTQRQEIVLEAFEEAAQRWGNPTGVLSDQGRQFYAWRGKTTFQKLLRKKGVEHAVARAHHPATCGKIERFWETLKRELWDQIEPKDLEEAREKIRHFIAHYNHFRPSQALDGMVPADRFFGAEREVREAIERAMKENELRLALGQEPRRPLFLVGQIGDRTVSLHGEKGKVVVQTEDGVRREMASEGFGMPPAPERKADVPSGAEVPGPVAAPDAGTKEEDDGALGSAVERGGGEGPKPTTAEAAAQDEEGGAS